MNQPPHNDPGDGHGAREGPHDSQGLRDAGPLPRRRVAGGVLVARAFARRQRRRRRLVLVLEPLREPRLVLVLGQLRELLRPRPKVGVVVVRRGGRRRRNGRRGELELRVRRRVARASRDVQAGGALL